MTGWREAAVALLALAALAGTTGAAAANDADRLFSFADDRIGESSGLADLGDTVATVNDSGDGPTVYVVDASSGRTSGVTTYSSGEVQDVEALAPGADGSVWVADIGDNLRARDTVTVYHVTDLRPGDRTVDAATYELAYPQGARDAEALLVHPRSQRLYVVSKTVFGGNVYAAPRTLRVDAVNELKQVAQVSGLVTDGAFLPDGRHLVLRGYGSASVYSFPTLERLGTFGLPEQEQGEAIAVGVGGRVLISSEGAGSPVLEVTLPRGIEAELSEPVVAPATPRSDKSVGEEGVEGVSWGVGLGWGLVGAALLALLALLLRLVRLRGRHSDHTF